MFKTYKITIDYGTHGSVEYGSLLLAAWLKLRHGLFADVVITHENTN